MPEEVKPCPGYGTQCWIADPCLHRKKSIGEPGYTSSNIGTQNSVLHKFQKGSIMWVTVTIVQICRLLVSCLVKVKTVLENLFSMTS